MTDTTHTLQLLQVKIEGRIKALEELEINSPYARGKIKAYNNSLEDIEELNQHDVSGQREQLKAFANYAQTRTWECGDKDLSEFVDDFLKL